MGLPPQPRLRFEGTPNAAEWRTVFGTQVLQAV
jgi:hypothetical protein